MPKKSLPIRFNGFQVEVLQREFHKDSHPSDEELERISHYLNVTFMQTKRWFGNYRTKLKNHKNALENKVNKKYAKGRSKFRLDQIRYGTHPSPGTSQSIYKPFNSMMSYIISKDQDQQSSPESASTVYPPPEMHQSLGHSQPIYQPHHDVAPNAPYQGSSFQSASENFEPSRSVTGHFSRLTPFAASQQSAQSSSFFCAQQYPPHHSASVTPYTTPQQCAQNQITSSHPAQGPSFQSASENFASTPAMYQGTQNRQSSFCVPCPPHHSASVAPYPQQCAQDQNTPSHPAQGNISSTSSMYQNGTIDGVTVHFRDSVQDYNTPSLSAHGASGNSVPSMCQNDASDGVTVHFVEGTPYDVPQQSTSQTPLQVSLQNSASAQHCSESASSSASVPAASNYSSEQRFYAPDFGQSYTSDGTGNSRYQVNDATYDAATNQSTEIASSNLVGQSITGQFFTSELSPQLPYSMPSPDQQASSSGVTDCSDHSESIKEQFILEIGAMNQANANNVRVNQSEPSPVSDDSAVCLDDQYSPDPWHFDFHTFDHRAF